MTNKILDTIMTISLTIVIIILSSLAILNTKYIYYYDIVRYDIVNSTTLSIDEIKENYNYTINFINNNSIKEFDPPSLDSSPSGSQHFADVRNVFNYCKYTTAILIAVTITLAVMRRPRKLNFLKYSAYSIIGFSILLVTTFILSFDKIFVVFHKLAFNNDNWILDPVTDPIIEILPQEFFMDCAIGILALSLTFSLITLTILRLTKNKS